jgi:N-acetylglucosaminyl-diphospho-decaprenol L-rhamnosyltransferase
MDLSILIVTYNSAKLIGRLLDHLARELQVMSAEVIVLDNASRDGTATLVARSYPWVKLIASPDNLGFAAGNNLAARHASGRYLLLLNPDAIPDIGSLKLGLGMLGETADVGLAGGELIGADGSRQPSARMFPTLRDEFFTLSGLAARFPQSAFFARLDRRWADPDKDALVDWIPGAFVFIPTDVFKRLSGFDERFFMYYEEVDLCRRMQQAGLKICYWPRLKAMHIGGESAKTVQSARVSKAGSQLESWRMRSGQLYYRKHHGVWGAAGLHWIEWSWHKLRAIKASLSGKTDKAQDFQTHCQQLNEAWRDTQAGQVSPARPW